VDIPAGDIKFSQNNWAKKRRKEPGMMTGRMTAFRWGEEKMGGRIRSHIVQVMPWSYEEIRIKTGIGANSAFLPAGTTAKTN